LFAQAVLKRFADKESRHQTDKQTNRRIQGSGALEPPDSF